MEALPLVNHDRLLAETFCLFNRNLFERENPGRAYILVKKKLGVKEAADLEYLDQEGISTITVLLKNAPRGRFMRYHVHDQLILRILFAFLRYNILISDTSALSMRGLKMTII